jgi:hypothetical protein
MNPPDTTTLAKLLAAPFPAEQIKWKPRVVRGNRALAVAYIDVRLVQDRLDAVFGPEGWQDSYQLLPSGNVVCTLRVKIGNEWIEKTDVGSGAADIQDAGNRMKAAFSDSLKRAAVKIGIGRYLHRIAGQWVGYDEKAKRLTEMPKLPAWAVPAKGQGNGVAPVIHTARSGKSSA